MGRPIITRSNGLIRHFNWVGDRQLQKIPLW